MSKQTLLSCDCSHTVSVLAWRIPPRPSPKKAAIMGKDIRHLDILLIVEANSKISAIPFDLYATY